MLKFWLYIIVLIILCVIGLTVGSANESVVTFDFLILKTNLSLAMVMVVGIVLGILIGLYIALLFCMRMWGRAHNAKAEARRYQKALDERTTAETTALVQSAK